MTAIVGAALGVRPLPQAAHAPHTTGTFLLAPVCFGGSIVGKSIYYPKWATN